MQPSPPIAHDPLKPCSFPSKRQDLTPLPFVLGRLNDCHLAEQTQRKWHWVVSMVESYKWVVSCLPSERLSSEAFSFLGAVHPPWGCPPVRKPKPSLWRDHTGPRGHSKKRTHEQRKDAPTLPSLHNLTAVPEDSELTVQWWPSWIPDLQKPLQTQWYGTLCCVVTCIHNYSDGPENLNCFVTSLYKVYIP